MDYKIDTDRLRLTKNGYNGCSKKQLSVYDWYSDLPETQTETNLIEVQFKNTRKAYYKNTLDITLEKGDIVAVESSPGHDIGEVTLTGKLVLKQMRKYGIAPDSPDIKRVYRKAKQPDLDKFNESKAREHSTMIKARELAERLKLNMKIGDVEFQGDGSKAIFYYIADERVDFRELIKLLAGEFHIRIEMRQIGARQEAGRIGGIGPCGRTLCCSTWLTGFSSVSTNAARTQDLSINMQKLAGQCAKLKCCMNYELEVYQDALKDFPAKETQLETQEGTFYHFKTDVFKRQITYSSAPNMAANLVTISPEEANEIIALNKQGEKPIALKTDKSDDKQKPKTVEFKDLAEQDSLTRFDKKKKTKPAGKSNNQQANNNPANKSANKQHNRRNKPNKPKPNSSYNDKNE